MVKILAFAGSARINSYNKKLVQIAAAAAREAGAEVYLVDLGDYPIPPYSGDLEDVEGVPPKARELRDMMIACDGFLIASPEYNSSISGYFKNIIDWVSRPDRDIPSLAAFKGKTAALMSASPGPLGGLRGLVHLRAILGNIGVMTLPDQVTVRSAHEAFDETGDLIDKKKEESLWNLAQQLVKLLKAQASNL